MVYYILAAALAAADHITKYIASEKLAGKEPVRLIPGLISFTYVENTGVAFGMFKGMNYVFIPLGLIAAALCIWYLHISIREGKRLRSAGVAMVIAGAVGNIADKIFRGFVVDFIDFVFIDFPVFNFADICITVGAVIAAGCVILEKENKSGV